MKNKYPKISISGDLGSGKSTVCSILAKNLSYEMVSIGEVQRRLAIKHNFTTLELNKYSRTHPEIDKELDGILIEFGESNESIVFDSRMAWHFVPASFKVCLIVDLNIASKRIFNANRGHIENYSNPHEAKEKIIERQAIEKDRYKKTYGVDLALESNYDLIVDTSYLTPNEVASFIKDCFSDWCEGVFTQQFCICPKRIYPTINTIRNINSNKLNELKELIEKNGYKKDVPITIIKYNNDYYIYDGHHRTLASIINHLSLISAVKYEKTNISGIPIGQYIKTNSDKTLLYDWESVAGFNFAKHPEDDIPA